jgi:hypothetical protein
MKLPRPDAAVRDGRNQSVLAQRLRCIVGHVS